MFPFDPPENIRKPLVFWCFQGDQKGTLGRKGLILLTYFDHNFRKPESAIPEPFFMTTCVSFYKAAGNLDAYPIFHRFSSLHSSRI